MDPMGKQIDLILLFYWLPDFGTIPNWLTREVATEDLKVFSNPFSPNTKLPRNHGLAGDKPHIWDPFSGCFILYTGEWDYLYLLLFQLDHICKSELGMPLNWLKDNLAVCSPCWDNWTHRAKPGNQNQSCLGLPPSYGCGPENKVQYPIPSHAESVPSKWQFNGKQKPRFSDKLPSGKLT